MSKNLINQADNDLIEAEQRPNLTSKISVSGGTNTINAVVEQQVIINQSSASTYRTVDSSHCNIFVIKCNTFANKCFIVLKRKAYINGFDIHRIKSFPSLFMKTNGDYLRCANENQEFHYGFITSIEDESTFYRVSYERRTTMPLLQSKLIDVAIKLGITPIKGTDILDQTGWRIYPLDIIKALSNGGFDMTVY